MAISYPRTLLTDDETSAGEVQLFDAIHEQLDDAWEVFHSVGLLHHTPKGARDGEIDFVLAHPDRGVVVLEVKGGDIECRHGEWQRRLDGQMTRVKDPVAQVVDQKHELLRLIDGVDGWSRHDLLVGHALGLPDVSVHSLALPPDLPPALIVDSADMLDLVGALEGVLNIHRGGQSADHRGPPGDAGMAMLRDLLAPELEIHVRLADSLREDDRALIRLTREQSLLLAHMSENQFMAISGCAGSGKTVLAVEHAQRLAQDGNNVLFVCFNKALGAWLNVNHAHPNIEFTHFHRLCVRLAKKHRIALPEYPDGAAPPEFFADELPEALVSALEASGPQWDALIVDEAQDLNDTWLTALRLGLRDEEASPVWLFFDGNQRVYDTRFAVPPGFLRFALKTNCRNTQAIHHELLKLYTGEPRPDVKGPAGRTPELIHAADQAAAVASVLDRLTGTDGVAPADIVVLSSHGREKSGVAQSLGGRLTDDATKPNETRIRFSSIRGFKGLESAVVVLCELEDIDERTRDMQLYVGMSRARTHCVIVAPPAG